MWPAEHSLWATERSDVRPGLITDGASALCAGLFINMATGAIVAA